LATVAAILAVLLLAEGAMRMVEARVDTPVAWGSRILDEKVDQIKELSTRGGVDVVFIGSSIVDVGIDPAKFVQRSNWAESAYNASVSAASPRVLEAWAEEVVLPLLKPKVMVIGLSSRALNDNGANQQAAFDRYINSSGRADHLGIAGLDRKIEAAIEAGSSLFRLRGELRSPHTFVENVTTETQGPSVTRLGYQRRLRNNDYEVTREFRERISGKVLNDYAVGGDELTALRGMIDTALAMGVSVYVVDMPVVEEDYIGLHPQGAADHALYEAALAELARDERFITASARDVVPLTDSFADPLHLNARGSRLLARWLATTILNPESAA
jgi:hypothetical protein